MNHQNDINYPQSYNFHQSNPQQLFNHFPSPTTAAASAPPDPSIYHSPDQYNPNSVDPTYDPRYYPNPNLTPSLYQIRNSNSGDPSYDQGSSVLQFDDYGRPMSSTAAAAGGGKNDNKFEEGGVYRYVGGGGNVREDKAPVLQFDDYGRPVTYGGSDQRGSADGGKVSKGVSEGVAAKEDVRNGVQKFRVVLLSEGGGLQGDKDVLCQIGLDGIQILDPATSRTLKVYLLETVTKWEVLDSNIFAFWTESSIDINARRVRLKSNSYTTTKILDMVAAASFQLKEMDEVAISEQPAEKKKGFPDWINLMKPTNEEKDHWVPDEASTKCTACNTYFGAFVRRHHCRNCGDIFCDKCTQGRIALTADEDAQQVRVCDQCMAEVTQRLSHVNEVAGRSSGFNRHEDLAKKLQEEMEKKRKTTPEFKSNQRMKEVECPTCTVHLKVDVPTSGSKTIECSVCQHPFVVSA